MSHQHVWALAALVGLPFVATSLDVVGPSFTADTTSKGSSLTGWHSLGQADWRAENGELVGKAKGADGSGWLMLDHSFQDVAVYTMLRCTGPCNTGVLLRAQKT